MVEQRAIEVPDFSIDPMGQLYFVLLTEMGVDVWQDREFTVEGPDIEITDQTDSNGEFMHAPAEFGDYELQVGDAAFIIPAIPVGDPPYPVHIPYEMLPDERDVWDGPTEEEINEEGLDTDQDQ